ncbi:unnamed protein product, partial [Rotaria socialis]
HDWKKRSDDGMLYSTDPYRRKGYGFHWEIDEQKCSYIRKEKRRKGKRRKENVE